MKRLIFLLITGFAAMNIWAQDITGYWNGVLKVQNIQLRLAFNIQKTESGYSATMDSPDQGANGIPVTSVSYENSGLKIAIANIGAKYEGVLGDDGNITGTFTQMGQSFPLNFSRQIIEKEKPLRPQEPAKPYPYYEEEVSFENNEDGVTLAGTLTLPQKDGIFPAVVLISGSGPQNRDEELMNHKPFLVIADYLTRNGIAVLRFDDRGTFASTGDFKTATSYDHSKDAEAGVKYLQTRKEINKKKIGLMGHSEGGAIAPMIAARNKDIAFIVLLAGTGVRGDQILLLQQNLLAEASGISEEYRNQNKTMHEGAFNIILQSTDIEQLKNDLTNYLKEAITDDNLIKKSIAELTNPWMLYFIKYDPAPALEKVKCPVLALNGEKDLQVPAKVNLDAIQTALTKGGNKRVTTKAFPGLNHLFQECTTGLPAEYATIEQTFSPAVLNEVLTWIKAQIK
jgi:dipeptidyl aminopeptidase/acylaminoacyl peptidase